MIQPYMYFLFNRCTFILLLLYPGCIDVSIAHDIYNSLQLSLDCLVLSTDLHLLNLVIPHNITDSIQPNWTIYFETVITTYV